MIHIIDNFYRSTDALLDLSNSCLESGCGAGIRSKYLSSIDPQSHDDLQNFLFYEFNLDPDRHKLITYLTKHTFDPDFTGRIHIDGRNPNSCDITTAEYDLVLCGMIFLSPAIDKDSGISFYNVNEDVQWSKEEEFNLTLNECYTYNKEQLENYHKNFYETLSVKNIQNRFVCWTAGSKYKNNITKKQNERIVQNFYISLV